MNKYIKIIIGGLIQSVVLILFSLLIHGYFFHSLWDSVEFMRDTNSWPFMPGAPISTTIWCIIISWFYSVFKVSIPSKGFKKGMIYGFYLCILFVFFVEVWTYLQFELSFLAVIAGILTYIIALPIGGGFISIIDEKL